MLLTNVLALTKAHIQRSGRANLKEFLCMFFSTYGEGMYA